MAKVRDSGWPLALFYAAVVFFLFFPILIVVPISFSNGLFMTFPPEEFSLRWYRAYFSDPVWMAATLRSLRIAAGVAVLATVIGTLAVVGLGRRRTRWTGAATGLFVAPTVVPHIIIALGVFILAVKLGAGQSELILIAAHSAIALPFVVLIVGTAYRQINPTLERAARVMGAGPVQAFRTATLPSLSPAILSAAIFAFFVSFDELVIAMFLMSGAETLPMRIWSDLRFEINPTIAAISVFFVALTTAAMGLAEILRRRATKNAKA